MIRLTDCYGEVLSYVLYLAAPKAGEGVGYDKAREDILALLREADARAEKAGYKPEDVEAARFAVCAFSDEAILRSSWEGAKRWAASQLQREFFNTHNAGVEFYDRLEALRQTDSPAKETFALCLGLGFQGKYFVENRPGELDGLRLRAIREAAGATQPDFSDEARLLFPEGYQTGAAKARRFNPWAFDWWMFLIPALAVVIAVELYLYLRGDLNIQLLGFFGSLS